MFSLGGGFFLFHLHSTNWIFSFPEHTSHLLLIYSWATLAEKVLLIRNASLSYYYKDSRFEAVVNVDSPIRSVKLTSHTKNSPIP